jgi:asparagine synthase (glutamine-hydrolysing)
MHLAAAVGVRTVALYSEITPDPARTGPLGDGHKSSEAEPAGHHRRWGARAALGGEPVGSAGLIMCGIAGIWSLGDRVDEGQLRRMGDQMASRGPDYQGIYLDSDANLGLVHQRLSIIDLDPRANQPMYSADGRYAIVFNGEIYNYQSRKRELMDQGVQFRTSSDTEVLLALFQRHGPGCLDLLNGMFAFAIYDRQARELFIARDRLGIKPLYFYRSGNCFAFTSDLKAFRKSGHIALQLSQPRIADFLLFEYVPQPHSIYADCSKLLPGHYMVVKSPTSASRNTGIFGGRCRSPPPTRNSSTFPRIVQRCVERRLVNDVKVGAFLSGLDSSAVVSGMRGDFSAFTIDFEGASNTLDRQRAGNGHRPGLQHASRW